MASKRSVTLCLMTLLALAGLASAEYYDYDEGWAGLDFYSTGMGTFIYLNDTTSRVCFNVTVKRTGDLRGACVLWQTGNYPCDVLIGPVDDLQGTLPNSFHTYGLFPAPNSVDGEYNCSEFIDTHRVNGGETLSVCMVVNESTCTPASQHNIFRLTSTYSDVDGGSTPRLQLPFGEVDDSFSYFYRSKESSTWRNRPQRTGMLNVYYTDPDEHRHWLGDSYSAAYTTTIDWDGIPWSGNKFTHYFGQQMNLSWVSFPINSYDCDFSLRLNVTDEDSNTVLASIPLDNDTIRTYSSYTWINVTFDPVIPFNDSHNYSVIIESPTGSVTCEQGIPVMSTIHQSDTDLDDLINLTAGSANGYASNGWPFQMYYYAEDGEWEHQDFAMMFGFDNELPDPSVDLTIDDFSTDPFYLPNYDPIGNNYTWEFENFDVTLTEGNPFIDDAWFNIWTLATDNVTSTPEPAGEGVNYLDWNTTTGYMMLWNTPVQVYVNDTAGNVFNTSADPAILWWSANNPTYNEEDVAEGTVPLNISIGVFDADQAFGETNRFRHLYNLTFYNYSGDPLQLHEMNVTYDVYLNYTIGGTVPNFYYDWEGLSNNSYYVWYVGVERNGIEKRIGPLGFSTPQITSDPFESGGSCLTEQGYRYPVSVNNSVNRVYVNFTNIYLDRVNENLSNVQSTFAGQVFRGESMKFDTNTRKTFNLYIGGDHVSYDHDWYTHADPVPNPIITIELHPTLSDLELINPFYDVELKYENDSTDLYPTLASSTHAVTILCTDYAPDTIDVETQNWTSFKVSTRERALLRSERTDPDSLEQERKLMMDASSGTLEFFMAENNTELVKWYFILEDYTGDFRKSGRLRIKSNVNGTIETIHTEPWYYDTIQDVYLKNDTDYLIEVYIPGSDTRNYGWIHPMDDGYRTIVVTSPPLTQAVDHYAGLSYSFLGSYNNSAVGFTYVYMGTGLNNVTFVVENLTGDEEYRSILTTNNGSFSFTVPRLNTTYMLRAYLDIENHSILDPYIPYEMWDTYERLRSISLPSIFNESSADVERFAVFFLLIFVLLIGGAANAGLIALIGTGWLALSHLFGFIVGLWEIVVLTFLFSLLIKAGVDRQKEVRA